MCSQLTYKSVLLMSLLAPCARCEDILYTTACQLLADPHGYDGKMVSFVARIKSPEEGVFIIAEGCSQAVEIKGYRFPNIIALTDPTSLARLHRMSFSRDEASRAEFQEALRKLDRKLEVVQATVIGLF